MVDDEPTSLIAIEQEDRTLLLEYRYGLLGVAQAVCSVDFGKTLAPIFVLGLNELIMFPRLCKVVSKMVSLLVDVARFLVIEVFFFGCCLIVWCHQSVGVRLT